MTAEGGGSVGAVARPTEGAKEMGDVSSKSQPHFSLYPGRFLLTLFFFQLVLILVPGTAKTHSSTSLRHGSFKILQFFFF